MSTLHGGGERRMIAGIDVLEVGDVEAFAQ